MPATAARNRAGRLEATNCAPLFTSPSLCEDHRNPGNAPPASGRRFLVAPLRTITIDMPCFSEEANIEVQQPRAVGC